jgi:hypothetical protein
MTKKSILLHVLVAFITLLVLIAARTPAQLVFSRLSKVPQFSQMVSYSSVNGTLWNGRLADLSVRNGTMNLMLGDAQWSINPLYFLMGKLNVHVQAKKDVQTIEGNVAISVTKTLSLSNMHIQAPASVVAQFYPVPGFLDGQFDVALKNMAVSKDGISELNGTVVIKDMKYTLASLVELGTYSAEVAMNKGVIRADLSDIAAQVGVSGNVKFTPKTRLYEVDMKLLPKPAANPLIMQTLSQFLRQGGDGSFQITKSAQL